MDRLDSSTIDAERGSRGRATWGIRAKVFSVVLLAALLPTSLVGTSSYWTARDALTEKLSDQLDARASLAAARIVEWFQERDHDVRVFASSSVMAALGDPSSSEPAAASQDMIPAYLGEVRNRYPVYLGLTVVRRDGRTVATAGDVGENRLAPAREGLDENPFHIDWMADPPLLWVDAPIRNGEGREVGSFVLSSTFDPLRDNLAALEPSQRIRLVDSEQRVLLAHPAEVADKESPTLWATDTRGIVEYRDADGEKVLAVARTIALPGLTAPLVLLVETEQDVAFAAVDELRRRILVMSLLVLALVIPLAYAVVVSFTKPLETLTGGAQAVSRGDYSLELPVRTSDEIGYLTQVFNRMTAALKKSHESLEQLSVTDELTKLCNRRQLSKTLSAELARAKRKSRPLSLIMIDIDHFKEFNDQLGHLRGDELLESMGAFLLANLRLTDVAARYGGEEFVLLLPETPIAAAMAKAEKLREGFAESVDGAEAVTLSLGVSAWPGDGETEMELLEAADRALYAAKDRGRDRVVVYGELTR